MSFIEKSSAFIQGQGGGGKKGGPSSTDDTLRSFAHANIIDAISEGPIEGLVNGAYSILINRTSITNVKEAGWQIRLGGPDSAPLSGFDATEAFVNVGADISQELGPVIRTITDTGINAIRIFMQLGVLFKTSKKGAMQATDGGWRIDLRSAGGQWTEVVTHDLNGEKTTSPTQFEHLISLEGKPGPWDIRVRARFGERDRITENMNWSGYAEVTDGRFNYPNTAIVGLTLSSEHVGSSTPERHYHIRGRKVMVPSNYNPITRAYSGIWNGAFKIAWTNNPAWVAYDMVQNNIYGIGSELDISVINKWRLYTIAQYCDQLVPSGYKDAAGNKIMEPRYTFNGVIVDKKNAIEALREITTVWRGMGFYSLNQFHLTADMPQDPAHAYGPANVIDGDFEYSTSSSKTRNSVVMVRFNDPNNLFEPAVEPVVNEKALKKHGWREKSVVLAGCSSRSLANRYGRWLIDTELNETETVTFRVGLDSIHALPGEVIAINDPRRAAVRMSGRIKAVTGGSTITLDGVLDSFIDRSQATIWIHKPDGTRFTRKANIQANFQAVNIGAGNATDDLVGCPYVISANNLAARLYRIVSIDEQDDNTFTISALQYDPLKFARIEQGIEFDPPPVTKPNDAVEAPTNFTVEGLSYTDGGRVRTDIELRWNAVPSQIITDYVAVVDTPMQNNVVVGRTNRTNLTYSTYTPGQYNFRLQAISITGARSARVPATYTVEGETSIGVGRVTDLVNAANLQGGANARFDGRDVTISWRNMMKVSSVAGVDEVESDPALYSHTTLEFFVGTTKVRTQRVVGNTFTYSFAMNEDDATTAGFASARRAFRIEAYIVDKAGRVSPREVIGLSNPAPAAPVVTLSSSGTEILIELEPIKAADLEGYLYWIETDSAFNPATTKPRADRRSNSYRYRGRPATGYFVRTAAYDAFGIDGLNYSSAMAINTGVDVFDTDPPDTPTGLTLTSVPGELFANWNRSVASDFAYYDVTIRFDGGEDVSFTTTTPRYSWKVPSGTMVFVTVRAVDAMGNMSNWALTEEHTVARDTIPPAVPTGLKTASGFSLVLLQWNRNTEADFSHYEIVYRNATFTPTVSTTPNSSTRANEIFHSDLEGGSKWWYAVRAVDTSGNASAWSSVVEGTATAKVEITSESLKGLVDATSFAANIEPVTVVPGATLPTTKITTTIVWQTKLYRWNGTAYTASTAVVDLDGKIIGSQISAGAVNTPQLAADAVVASKMALMDLTNLVGDDQLQDISAWSGTGQSHVSLITDYSETISMDSQSRGAFVISRPANVGTGTSLFSKRIPAKPDEEFWTSVRINGPAGNISGHLQFLNMTGGVIGARPTPDKTTTGWSTETFDGKAPAGTAYIRFAFYVAPNAYPASGQIILSAPTIRRKNGGELIIDGSLKARHVAAEEFITNSAQIGRAVINDAHVLELSAEKLKAGTSIAGSVLIDGRAVDGIGGDRLIDNVGALWDQVAGAGSTYRTNSSVAGTTGGQVMIARGEGPTYNTSKARLPFDPTKLYKVTLSVRRVGAALDATSPGNMYLGICGYAGDKTTMVNNNGEALLGLQRYMINNVSQDTVPTGWRQYTFYIRGQGNPVSGAGTIANPATLHPDVRYITPLATFNVGATTGSNMALNFARIDQVDEDAGEVINAGSTLIEPGKVLISGNTKLSNWIMGGDETKINGGMLSAGTVKANSAIFGMRGITIRDIQFEFNDPAVNSVSWTAGTIEYVNDAGNNVTASVLAGNVAWSSGIQYLYYTQGDNGVKLRNTPTLSVAKGDNNVILASYQGGKRLNAIYGRTVIDGPNIKTGSLTAANFIKTEAVITESAQIKNAIVDTLTLAGNAVTVPTSQSLSNVLGGTGNWRTANTASFTLPQNGQATITWFGCQGYTALRRQASGIRLFIDGSEHWSRGGPGDSRIETDWLSMGWSVFLAAGSHNFRVDWIGGDSDIFLHQRILIVQGSMR